MQILSLPGNQVQLPAEYARHSGAAHRVDIQAKRSVWVAKPHGVPVLQDEAGTDRAVVARMTGLATGGRVGRRGTLRPIIYSAKFYQWWVARPIEEPEFIGCLRIRPRSEAPRSTSSFAGGQE